MDAHVVAMAARGPTGVVYTEDVGDLRRIAEVAEQPPEILPVPRGL